MNDSFLNMRIPRNLLSYNGGFAKVELNKKWNYIDKNCKVLSKQWFDVCCDFKGGFAFVMLNGEWFSIDKNGKLLKYKKV